MKPIFHPRQAIELFHCHFLAAFDKVTAPNAYAIKGGCNLRMLLGSPRASEDLDLDIQQVSKHTLQKNVEKIIGSSLEKALTRHNVNITDISAPKQTNTVQRWKITLDFLNEKIPTKIEFSRRGLTDPQKRTLLPTSFQTIYQVEKTILTHYGKNVALKQKIKALAGRTITQSRDVFDAAFLIGTGAKPPTTLEKGILKKAEENIRSLTFEDYMSQVVPYLEEEYAKKFTTQETWDKLQSKILTLLKQIPAGQTDPTGPQIP